MKAAITFLLFLFFSTGCEKRPFLSLSDRNQNKIIALQPFGNFDEEQLSFIYKAISSRFGVTVLILKPLQIPISYRGTDGEYSADSLILFLSGLTREKVVDVIGLTHVDIFILRGYKIPGGILSRALFEPRGLFGYGYVSGNSCVVSDYRVMCKDRQLLNSRLLKLMLHEIGHNLGLAHCTVDTCVMYEGDIPNLDRCNGNYCDKCRRILNE